MHREDEIAGLRDFVRISLLVVAGFASFFVFAFGAARSGTFADFESDIIPHALMTHGQLHGTWWTYSLWYPALRFLTAGGSADQLMINAGFMLLGFIATARGIVTARLLVASGYGYFGAVLATVGLVSCLALPTFGLTDYFYLGTLTPNSLASATQLVAILFAIPAVYFLARWFAEPSRTNLWWVAAAGALSALAKPGMTPAWIAGYVLLALVLVVQKRARLRFILALPLAVPVFTIVLAYLISFNSRSSLTRIKWFEEWSVLSDAIVVDLLRSWLFPILVAAACLYHCGRSQAARLLAAPWAVALPALLQASMLNETDAAGNVRGYGNFMSGTAVATSALYFMSVAALIALPMRLRIPLFVILGVQTVTGLIHLWNWTVTGSYF
jgi:hypothetical protein